MLKPINLGATREDESAHLMLIIQKIFDPVDLYAVDGKIGKSTLNVLSAQREILDKMCVGILEQLKLLIIPIDYTNYTREQRYENKKQAHILCLPSMPHILSPLILLWHKMISCSTHLFSSSYRTINMKFTAMRRKRNNWVLQYHKWCIMYITIRKLRSDIASYLHYLPRDLLYHYISPMCKDVY